MGAQVNKALMESYYQTYNAEDPIALRAFYHPEVEFITAQGAQHGPDAIIATYQYLITMFHDKMTPTAIAISGDTAVVSIEDCFTAKQTIDDFMGMALKKDETFTLHLTGIYQAEAGQFKKITIDMQP